MRPWPILRLLLAGLLAWTALLTPWWEEDVDTPQLIVGYQVAHADSPGDWPMFGHDPARTGYNPDETQLKPPLRLKWSYGGTAGQVWSSPALANGVVYDGSEGAGVYALDAATGARRWSYRPNGMRVSSSPAVADGLVYVGGGGSGGPGGLHALEAASGALRWTYRTSVALWSSPAVANGMVYVKFWDGMVYALEAATGALSWSYQTGACGECSPAVAGGVVYVGSSDRKIYALDASTGALRWSYTTGDQVSSSPAVANGVVYVGSTDDKVYGLDAATGALRWSYTTGGDVFYSSPAVANGVVYVGSNDGKLYALDAATGALRWRYATGGNVYSSPAAANGVVYVGGVALDAETGALKWSHSQGGGVFYSPAIANGVRYAAGSAFEAQPPPVTLSMAPFQTASATFPISWTVPITWTGTAAGSYDVQYRDGPSGAWTDLITATTALSTTFTGGQDGHTYGFRARATTTTGAVGDWSEPVSTTVDLTAPTGSIEAQGWSSPYISNTVTLSVSASDVTSGVFQMQFGSDGQSFNPWETYGTSSLYLAPPGATTVYGRFKDNAGNVSPPVSATIALDNVSPTGSVSINGGATYATSMTATLALSATDGLSGVSEMALSNDGTAWNGWEGYSTSKSWPLASGGDGPRTVYARFRDAAQNVSPVYSDTIILDTAAPTGTVVINGGASDTNSTAVTLSLSAADGLSGLAQMSLSNDGQRYTDWEAYAPSKSWRVYGGNGTKTVYARFRDNAGNVSDAYTDTIILNTTAPSSAVSPLSLYQSTTAFTVTWSGSAGGSGLAAYDLQYKGGAAGQWTDWITSTLSTSAIFTGTEGHTYYFQSRARDVAGNVEPYVGGEGHTRTTVDLTPPTGSLSINGGALDTTARTVTLGLSASDSLSGVYQASYSDDEYVWSAWESYLPTRSWTVPTGEGEKAVWARFRDAAGNISATVSDTIRLDTSVAPTYGFSINEGALFTNQVTVTLSLPANPSTAQMMVSNDGGFYGAAWEPYAAYKAWAITQYGSYVIARTVYVKYRDVNGSVSATYQDDIILDLTAPSGSVSIEGAGSASVRTAASSVTLRLSASDDVSGVGGMMVSSSPAFSGASWESFSASKSWSLESGGKVYVAFKDNAGNASPIYAASLSGAKESLPSMALGTVHPKTGGQIASAEAKATVAFPPGAVAAKAEVTLVPAVESNLQANTGALKSAGKFLTLTAKAGETSLTSVSKAYTITVGYTAADVAGVNESSLGIYWWNGSAWQKEPTSRVDTAARTVSATLDHLSAFAVLGESSTRTVYLPLVIKSYGGAW